MDIENLILITTPKTPRFQYQIVLHCSFESNSLFDTVYQDIVLENIETKEQLFQLIFEVLMIKNFSLENIPNYLDYFENLNGKFHWIAKLKKNFYQKSYILNMNIFYYDNLSYQYEVVVNCQKEECDINNFYATILNNNCLKSHVQTSIDAYLEKKHLDSSILTSNNEFNLGNKKI